MLNERHKKQTKKDYFLYDFIHMKYPRKGNLQRQKSDQQFPRAGSGSKDQLQTSMREFGGVTEIF